MAIDGLEQCPFCEFKAIFPPVEGNGEFCCHNPDCYMVSCRLCREESHSPKTCEELQQEKLAKPERRVVEEAMSEALICNCPWRALKGLKESGCNTTICPGSCVYCYVCKKPINGHSYEHFATGRCSPDRSPNHQEEVNRAETQTVEQILAENPGLKREDLIVQRPLARHSIAAPQRQASPPS